MSDLNYYLGVRSSRLIGVQPETVKLRIPGFSNLVDKLRGRDKEKEPVVWDEDVRSSNLDRVVYSPETKLMRVHFKSGGIYQYTNVPQRFYIGMMRAKSKGKYFHKYIRFGFKYEAIR